MSTIKVNNITNANGTSAIAIDSSGVATFSKTLVPSSSMMYRNLIINGDMRIDQRNSGASVTPTNTQYIVDRWQAILTQSAKYSAQQNAAAVTPPAGFTNYLGVTSLSAYSITSSDSFNLRQPIEGNNIADLGWGTADAKTVTLSFWVRSSLTGTFGGSLRNSNATRSYPFSYSISAADTWEYKTVTIPGDTTGTWLTTNGAGILMGFGLGVGSTISGTAGAWAGANYISATGATSVVGTNGATFYITGVQLEVGTEATPFEHRPYDMELQRCMRYYWRIAEGSGQMLGLASYYTTGGVFLYVQSPTPMRNTPTVDQVNGTDYYGFERNGAVDGLGGSFALYRFNGVGCQLYTTTGASGTAGQSGILWTNNAASYIALTAEL